MTYSKSRVSVERLWIVGGLGVLLLVAVWLLVCVTAGPKFVAAHAPVFPQGQSRGETQPPYRYVFPPNVQQVTKGVVASTGDAAVAGCPMGDSAIDGTGGVAYSCSHFAGLLRQQVEVRQVEVGLSSVTVVTRFTWLVGFVWVAGLVGVLSVPLFVRGSRRRELFNAGVANQAMVASGVALIMSSAMKAAPPFTPSLYGLAGGLWSGLWVVSAGVFLASAILARGVWHAEREHFRIVAWRKQFPAAAAVSVLALLSALVTVVFVVAGDHRYQYSAWFFGTMIPLALLCVVPVSALRVAWNAGSRWWWWAVVPAMVSVAGLFLVPFNATGV